MFSANYFGMDEDKGTVDGERTLDRIAAVPFGEWSDMSVNDFAAKQNKFKTIVDNPTKPTEFVIGEMGDYLRSEEFKEKRLEFSDLKELADEATEKQYPDTDLLTGLVLTVEEAEKTRRRKRKRGRGRGEWRRGELPR